MRVAQVVELFEDVDAPSVPLAWLVLTGFALAGHVGAAATVTASGAEDFRLIDDRTRTCVVFHQAVVDQPWLWLAILAWGAVLCVLSVRRGYGLMVRTVLFLPSNAGLLLYGMGMGYLANKFSAW